jgi:hypothetical protein
LNAASVPEEPPGAVGVAAGRDQHADDLPVLVYRAVYVAPHTVDLDIRLIHEPPVTWRVAAKPSDVGQQRREPLHPPVDGDVIELDPALDQQFLDVSVGEFETQVPPDRDDDHLGREPVPSERRLRRQPEASTVRQLHCSSLPRSCERPTQQSRIICSTNAIESLNARYRRAVRARGHFPNEQAALKCLYLATRALDPTGRGRARWVVRWKPALNAFAITFEGRIVPSTTN